MKFKGNHITTDGRVSKCRRNSGQHPNGPFAQNSQKRMCKLGIKYAKGAYFC